MNDKELIDVIKSGFAVVLDWLGMPYHCSTDISGCISRGYGKLDVNGFWEYQLPYRPCDWNRGDSK